MMRRGFYPLIWYSKYDFLRPRLGARHVTVNIEGCVSTKERSARLGFVNETCDEPDRVILVFP